MKQKVTLGSSISILIGVVIVILALVRGPAQTVLLVVTFALWGLWLVLALLRPSWQANHAYRAQEEREAQNQNVFSTRNVVQLLLCHVNSRITDYLKSAYPDVSWEWTMENPALFIAQGGTGRIRVYGVKDYEYADIVLDRKGSLTCSMVKIVPIQNNGQSASAGKKPMDPQAWYTLEGRGVLENLVADLSSRGHNSLTVNEDGSISIQPKSGKARTLKQHFSNLPDKAHWPQLADVLTQEGFVPDVQASKIVVSW